MLKPIGRGFSIFHFNSADLMNTNRPFIRARGSRPWAGPLIALCIAAPLLAVAADLASTFGAAARYESGGDLVPLREIEKLVAQSSGNPVLRQDLEAGLAGMLGGDATFEAKRFACQQLAVIGTQSSVPALGALLKGDGTAGLACLALVNNPSPEADRVLAEAAASLGGAARLQAIGALGVRRHAPSVPALSRLALEPDSQVAGAAITALGRIGDDPAVRTLKQLCALPDAKRADIARVALLHAADQWIKDGNRPPALALYNELVQPTLSPGFFERSDAQPAGNPPQVRRGAFEALVRIEPAGAEKRVRDVLTAKEVALVPSAIAAVATLPGNEISRSFAAFLPQLDPAEQVLLIQALAARTDPDTRVVLETQLQSADGSVRLAAIAALGRVGDAATVPILARALSRAAGALETRAVETALVNLKGGDAVDQALAAQLRNRMAGPKTPILAALVWRAHPNSFRIFQAEAGSSDSTTAKLAFQGLSRTAKADQVPDLLQALTSLRAADARNDVEAILGQALSRLGNASSNSTAVRTALAQAKETEPRCSLVRLLALGPDAPALDALKTALTDSDARVQEAALRTLADWPDPAAWDPLAQAYRQSSTDTQRVVLLRGLTRLLGEQNPRPDATLIERYRTVFAAAQNDSDRKLILGALAGCAHPEALKLAVEQLGVSGVRAEAAAAVKKIAEAIQAQHPEAAQDALRQLR